MRTRMAMVAPVLLGDDIADFPDLDQGLRFAGDDAYRFFGDRYWALPNPIHGSWVANEVR